MIHVSEVSSLPAVCLGDCLGVYEESFSHFFPSTWHGDIVTLQKGKIENISAKALSREVTYSSNYSTQLYVLCVSNTVQNTD